MEKVTRFRRSALAEWQARLARWNASSSTVGEFCRREGVSDASFYLWRRKLARGAVIAPSRRRGSGRLVPVEVVADSAVVGSSPQNLCELVVGSLVCRVPQGLDDGALRRLIRVLGEEGRSC